MHNRLPFYVWLFGQFGLGVFLVKEYGPDVATLFSPINHSRTYGALTVFGAVFLTTMLPVIIWCRRFGEFESSWKWWWCMTVLVVSGILGRAHGHEIGAFLPEGFEQTGFMIPWLVLNPLLALPVALTDGECDSYSGSTSSFDPEPVRRVVVIVRRIVIWRG